MNTKKFPTPNLDAWNDGIEGSFRDVNEAVQADIALAVEEAAKICFGALGIVGDVPVKVVAPEALTVAGKLEPALVPMQFIETRTKTGGNTFSVDSIEPVKPVGKRCGTCAHWSRLEASHPLGTCSCPVPFNLSTSMLTRGGGGSDCPCWKAKP